MTLFAPRHSSHSHTIDHAVFSVTGVPVFNDNYVWILVTRKDSGVPHVVVIDPGDANPVIDYCRRQGMVPDQIWLTHHHADHVGGVADLCHWISQQTSGLSVPVYGPAAEEIAVVTHPLRGGECFDLNGVPVQVLAVPGHTRGHLAYQVGSDGECAAHMSPPALFCGDVLFGLGCGRLFEGTASQMFDALMRIRNSSPQTRVYCAHEYTLLNLPFALSVDPGNPVLERRAASIRQRRAAGEPTVPLDLAEECATNPFLRCDQVALKDSAMAGDAATPLEVFTALRRMRDTFKVPQ